MYEIMSEEREEEVRNVSDFHTSISDAKEILPKHNKTLKTSENKVSPVVESKCSKEITDKNMITDESPITFEHLVNYVEYIMDEISSGSILEECKKKSTFLECVPEQQMVGEDNTSEQQIKRQRFEWDGSTNIEKQLINEPVLEKETSHEISEERPDSPIIDACLDIKDDILKSLEKMIFRLVQDPEILLRKMEEIEEGLALKRQKKYSKMYQMQEFLEPSSQEGLIFSDRRIDSEDPDQHFTTEPKQTVQTHKGLTKSQIFTGSSNDSKNDEMRVFPNLPDQLKICKLFSSSTSEGNDELVQEIVFTELEEQNLTSKPMQTVQINTQEDMKSPIFSDSSNDSENEEPVSLKKKSNLKSPAKTAVKRKLESQELPFGVFKKIDLYSIEWFDFDESKNPNFDLEELLKRKEEIINTSKYLRHFMGNYSDLLKPNEGCLNHIKKLFDTLAADENHCFSYHPKDVNNPDFNPPTEITLTKYPGSKMLQDSKASDKSETTSEKSILRPSRFCI